ncbi:uncharacterized protein LOC124891144 [Capsicum annuum]|uniref:uncharacterized protein LOC124891144 n=1 Tax=Capsicum annuum TaxID=4072 RepID=UPI001FB07D71|nr:uncharacterized protein LOC124891144 [Capsicum annuum]
MNSEVVADEPEKKNPVESENSDSFVYGSMKVPEKQEEIVLKTIPRPPHLFPQRLRKKADDAKFSKFMALDQMPGYAKFMKDLVTKKQAVSCKLEADLHLCNAIFTRTLMQKKTDPGAVTIPCTIRTMKFTKALCDLGANINLMPLTIYKKLGLGNPTPTNMRLVMADRSVKRPVGILYDVL